MSNVPEDKKYATIRNAFEIHLDNPNCRVFGLRPYGAFYAENKKTKKPARGVVSFPNDGSLGETTNLKFMRDWIFVVVAVPRADIKDDVEVSEE